MTSWNQKTVVFALAWPAPRHGPAYAVDLAALTAQVERQALQSTIDRMHDQ